jgi:hypothetical protein
MSYIINSTNPFVSIKLTEVGREKLSMGALNYSYWAVGDSEIDYNREDIVNSLSFTGTSKILRPKDQQPDIKYFVSTTGSTILNPITGANVRTLKAVINNKADERGFFSGNTDSYITLVNDRYVKSYGTISNTIFSGGTNINISSGLTKGDIIIFKITNPVLGSLSANTNNIPTPTLSYKIINIIGSSITVDRNLPNFSGLTSVAIQYYVYPGGEVSTAFGSGTTSAYWNNGTLSFEQNDKISIVDNQVWCMNNVWAETIPGINSGYRDYKYFGSYQFLGEKETYLEFGLDETNLNSSSSITCSDFSAIDTTCKSLSLIHYTNNTISNFYGEFFYIDGLSNKIFELNLPTLMYHRRDYTTGSGTTMGMRFIASGLTKNVGLSDIKYIDLIEDPSLVCGTPNIIGRVYPQLKIVSIHDEEIIAAMSYKSNRNWTLPQLDAKTWAPVNGGLGGILPVGSTIYLTYVLENTLSGLTTSLGCQKYSKLTNTTLSPKDVVFNIDGTNMFPYMRKIETDYDGIGFYGHNFKLLYQIVDNNTTRPTPNGWNVVDFTSGITGYVSGQTINPSNLESGFYTLTQSNSGTTNYSISSILNIPLITNTGNTLNFGDEKFFYGNIKTYVGATVYKTIFSVSLDGTYTNTTNPSRTAESTSDICVTEVGIYDSSQELVAIGKMSEPIKISNGENITIEMGIDF